MSIDHRPNRQLSASRPVLVISYSFLDTNCATKLPLEIGIILELPSPLGWSRDCLCIDVYGSESSASTNGPAARTAFRGLPRSSTARVSAKRFVFNAPQRPQKEESKKTCRVHRNAILGQLVKQEAWENTQINGRDNCYEMSVFICGQCNGHD